MSEREFDLIREFAELDEDKREAFEVYLSAFGSSSDDNTFFDNFREAYQGKWSSEEDFARYIVEECGMLDNVPESLKDYFDFERYADDLFRYDYDFQDGYVFRC